MNQLTKNQMAEDDADSDDFYVFRAGATDEENTLKLINEDKLINTVIDSGASCNLLSEEEFNFVTGGRVEVLECTKKVYAYASVEPLQLIGKCILSECVPQTHQSLGAEFYITYGKAATLLGRKTSELLGMLRVGVSINSCKIKANGPPEMPKHADRKAALKGKFPKVFQGLGKLKGYQLKFHIDQDIHPVAQPVLRIPFSRRDKVNEKLEDLLKLDVIIDKVEGPTSWVNPSVVVEKPNGDVRLCLDMRQANRAIVREKHPVPTVEETLQEVSHAKVFSKLDLNMAFHQIQLHPDSRDITFAAPNSLYRYKRLLFGVNMATEKFQQIVWQVIKDCRRAYNLHDDLRVVGADDKEHDENLERVMRKLEERGLTLNYEK